ncbi:MULTISPECIES: hypothetical protein [Shewanella]|uniref:DUF4044 domain-containing protein n=1 Tax=Shewanella phaeophyticola TaxID=2978345 RepID=A0ABT2P3J8_9GAMM|nr:MULTISPECIES: hypothetical protein [Shewanella]MCT8986270.1 hypothetical protein [Shewanella sp. KJ10-1]
MATGQRNNSKFVSSSIGMFFILLVFVLLGQVAIIVLDNILPQ